MVEQLALVLNLSLGTFQPYLSTFPLFLLDSQLGEQLFILLFRGPQGLFSLEAEVDLIPDIVSCLLDPFFSHKDLLGDLYKNNIATPCEQERDKKTY